jgi:uncharacterized lipoprotein YajG
MNRTLATALFVLILSSSPALASDLPRTINIQVPEGLALKICPAPMWKNLNYVWEGVSDSRENKAVGSQSQGKKEEVEITADPSLDKIFETAIPEIFNACGLKQVPKSDEDAMRISVEIEKFHAGITKTFFTGKGIAESWLKITVKKGYSTETANFGYETESKGIRSGKIKRLKKALDDLLADTLGQIVNVEPLKALK